MTFIDEREKEEGKTKLFLLSYTKAMWERKRERRRGKGGSEEWARMEGVRKAEREKEEGGRRERGRGKGGREGRGRVEYVKEVEKERGGRKEIVRG